jgi:hypothetical protein
MLMDVTIRARQSAGRLFLGATITALLLSMSACTASSSASAGSRAAKFQARRLALGTLRLEGTPEAVDPQSAAQLLPLWQLMDELNTNSAAAPQEILAVIQQIRATMTAAQVSAIDELTLSASESADSVSSVEASSTSASPGGNRMPMEVVVGGGMPPDGAGGIPGGEGMPPRPQGQNAGPATSGTTTTAPSGVFQQVISLLQSKLQAVPAS